MTENKTSNIQENPQTDKKETVKNDSGKSKRTSKRVNFLVIFLVINIFLFLGSIYLLYDLPQKAQELKKVKDEALQIEESSKVDATGLEVKQNKDNWEVLQAYFPDEAGVIRFITDLETLKKNEVIKDMSFVSQDTVRDKTGSSGIPFIMEIEGSWEKVDSALNEFYKLPYIVRVINVDVTEIEEGSVNFKYGGFIYVSERLSKSR